MKSVIFAAVAALLAVAPVQAAEKPAAQPAAQQAQQQPQAAQSAAQPAAAKNAIAAKTQAECDTAVAACKGDAKCLDALKAEGCKMPENQ